MKKNQTQKTLSLLLSGNLPESKKFAGKKEIPVGFLERDDIPPLLGRLEFIEVLKITFENFLTKFEK